MSVQGRNILPPSVIVAPNGDLGAEGDHSPDPSTHGALGSETAHGDVAGWDSARANALGEKPGQSAGFALSNHLDSSLSAHGGDGGHGDHDSDTPSNSSGYGKGIAGEQPFSSHGYQDSDTGSDTSGYGKGIGNTDPLSRRDSI